jgi:HSP20 family protein
MAEKSTKLEVKTGGPPAARTPEVWAPFDALRREMNRLFEDYTTGWWRPPAAIPATWPGLPEWQLSPAVDIVEQDGGYRITAELPGIDRNNVEVKVAGGAVTISGEKTEEKTEEKTDSYMSERRYGRFQRSFLLPDSVDADKIEASFANGVLTVTLPKSEKAIASEKKIEVKAA